MDNGINKLVRDGVELHLINGIDDFQLQDGNSYNPATATENDDGTWPVEVNETIRLRIVGDINAIARRQKTLRLLARQAREFIRETANSKPVWWHRRLPCETEESRALVRRIQTVNTSPVYNPQHSPSSAARDYIIGIARAPKWEALTTTTVTKSGALETGGDVWNYGAVDSVGGDTGARIASLRFFNSVGGPLGDAWCGIRSDELGDRTAFVPVWQCGDGTSSTGADTVLVGGAGATTDFTGGTEMLERFSLTLTQAVGAANADEHRGKFLILMRAQVTGATVCRVRLKSGYERPANPVYMTHDFVTISDTNNLLIPLGSVEIPPNSLHETQDIANWEDEAVFSLAIEAELVSGAGNLVMDRFVVIPQSEGWLSFKNSVFGVIDDVAHATFVLTTPGDSFLVRPFNSQLIEMTPRLEVDRINGFYLPPGEASIVYAAQRTTVQNTADRGKLEAIIYPRWTEFRGDDT